MKKIYLFLLLIVLTGFSYFLFFEKNFRFGIDRLSVFPAKSSASSPVIKGTSYSVINHISALKIDNKINSLILSKRLDALGLSDLSTKQFIEKSVLANGDVKTSARSANYKNITVSFFPISELPPNLSDVKKIGYVHLISETSRNSNTDVIFSGKTISDTFDIPVYVNIQLLKQQEIKIDNYLNLLFLKAIFYNFNDIELKNWQYPNREFTSKIETPFEPFFVISQSITENVLYFLKVIGEKIVPLAEAQTCGSVTCGNYISPISGVCSSVFTTTTTYRCSNDGSDCSATRTCVYGATCDSNTTSTPNPQNGKTCYSDLDCTAPGATCLGDVPSSCQSLGSASCSQQTVSVSPYYACKQPEACSCYIGQCSTPSCNWSAWSACSAACGGGTQSSSSATCGTVTRACNTGSCCGNGVCSGGETCSTCSSDCGVCSPPSGPYCGDRACNNGETCGSCAGDCGSCSCTPSCSTACGQSDGCGGNCSTSDSGVPSTITGQNPASNGSVVTISGQATLSWTAQTLTDLYEIQVYPVGTAAGQECSVPNSHCPAPISSNSYTFTVDSGVSSYTWRVRGINNTCSTQTGGWTTPISFTFGGGIAGNFYLDNTNAATLNSGTGLCQATGPTLLSAPGGSSLTATYNSTTVPGTISGNSFTVSGLGYDPNTLVNLTAGSGYRCTCPAGCGYSGLSVPVAGVNFYLTTNPASWWQTANGYLYAAQTTGTAIRSPISTTTCTSPTCIPAISMYDSADTPNSDSVTLTGGGSINSDSTGALPGGYLNESGVDRAVTGLTQNGPQENYAYFSQLYGITSSSTADFTGNQPSSAPTNGNAYYSNGDVTISNAWTVNTGSSYVVFVNGNLTVANNIQVAEGGFVAFIVKGNVTIANTVGSNSSNAASVAGVFIADGQIITESNPSGTELKIVLEGTYVGWSGFQLNRNFNGANVGKSNTEAVETFVFRPDFLLTVPEKMTKPLYLWQETN